jgi:hypothetical protein
VISVALRGVCRDSQETTHARALAHLYLGRLGEVAFRKALLGPAGPVSCLARQIGEVLSYRLARKRLVTFDHRPSAEEIETRGIIEMPGRDDAHWAARRAGIKVANVKMAAFAIAGGIAALAGVIGASRALGVGVFSGGGIGGGTLLLESIAAAVIGGVSLFGGRGSIHAALLGALVIGSVQIGLNLMGVENEIRLIVTGLLLVLAVSIDKLIERFTGQQGF